MLLILPSSTGRFSLRLNYTIELWKARSFWFDELAAQREIEHVITYDIVRREYSCFRKAGKDISEEMAFKMEQVVEWAAIIGKRFGHTKIFADKSLEGSLACFAACLVIGLFVAWLFPAHLPLQIVVIGALTATIVELLSLWIDDNLTIPLISGLVMQILILVSVGSM